MVLCNTALFVILKTSKTDLFFGGVGVEAITIKFTFNGLYLYYSIDTTSACLNTKHYSL